MNRRKKQIYGAILIFCALALAVDRVTVQATAPSAAYAGAGPVTDGVGVEPPAGPVVSVAVTPFPSDLPPVLNKHTLRDVFATTDTIRTEMLTASAGDARGPEGRTAPERSVAESFQQDRKLTAVMLGQQSSFAIVDGHWLRVGSHLAGCELTAMTGTTATFHCADGEVALSVALAETADSVGK